MRSGFAVVRCDVDSNTARLIERKAARWDARKLAVRWDWSPSDGSTHAHEVLSPPPSGGSLCPGRRFVIASAMACDHFDIRRALSVDQILERWLWICAC